MFEKYTLSETDHGFGFNKVNLNSSYITPLSDDYTWQYHGERRLTEKTFPSAAWISYNYDPAKLTSVETSEGDIISFGYSPLRNKGGDDCQRIGTDHLRL